MASVCSCHCAAVGEDGSLFVWGSGEFGQLGTGDTTDRLAPTRVAGLPAHVRQVAAGYSHTGIVTEAGDLLMCGADGGLRRIPHGGCDKGRRCVHLWARGVRAAGARG